MLNIVRLVSVVPSRRNNALWTACLVAVVALLVMHGFEGATLNLVDAGHRAPHLDDSPDPHGAVGLCVFVAAVAGIGLVAAQVRRRRSGFAVVQPPTFAPAGWPTWSRSAGRSRLIDLRVLRL